jgi:hypothetical protein
MSMIGDNSGADVGDDYFELGDEMIRLQSRFDRLKKPFNETDSMVAADIKKDIGALIAAIEKSRMEKQRPFMDSLEKVRMGYRTITELAAKLKSDVALHLTTYGQEEARKKRVAAQAAADALLAAQLAAQVAALEALAPDANVFDKLEAQDADKTAQEAALAAQHAEKVAEARTTVPTASGQRAVGLRTTYSVRVTGPTLLVEFFNTHPDVVAAATKAANAMARSSKGAISIPGCVVVPTETAV